MPKSREADWKYFILTRGHSMKERKRKIEKGKNE